MLCSLRLVLYLPSYLSQSAIKGRFKIELLCSCSLAGNYVSDAFCISIHVSVTHMLQVWHAVGRDRTPLRKQYLEVILPPFIAALRRWRPLLAGIHELATADGLNPFVVDDRSLAADALPLEVDILNFHSHRDEISVVDLSLNLF